jgi:hypothetical protein
MNEQLNKNRISLPKGLNVDLPSSASLMEQAPAAGSVSRPVRCCMNQTDCTTAELSDKLNRRYDAIAYLMFE